MVRFVFVRQPTMISEAANSGQRIGTDVFIRRCYLIVYYSDYVALINHCTVLCSIQRIGTDVFIRRCYLIVYYSDYIALINECTVLC